jgi:hypothetical protein
MATTIFERRAEVGLMKALGAGKLVVASIFLCGGYAAGLIGGLAGFGVGSLLAHHIGRSIFNSDISIPPVLLPVILAIAVIVTFAGSAAAIRRAVGSGSGVCVARGTVSVWIKCRDVERGHVFLGTGLGGRRAHGPHTSMFLRMLVRAAVLRRGRAVSALFAMVVAAAVATAMLNLYVDVQAKLRREFRNYGANIILVGRDGASLPADALTHVDSVLAGRGIAAPFGLVVARTSDGQPIVVAGTDFERVKQLDKWWSVSAWPENAARQFGDMTHYENQNPRPVAENATRVGHPESTSPALIGVRALAAWRRRISRLI